MGAGGNDVPKGTLPTWGRETGLIDYRGHVFGVRARGVLAGSPSARA